MARRTRLVIGAGLVSCVAVVGGTGVLSGSVCHSRGGLEFCPADGQCHPDGKCDKCKGHLMEDIDSHVCANRVPFTSHAAVDCVAAALWFFGAGLAMSAGVGGGGIFVPLGVVLLRFASKPSTGLSQASIFGASLGGLLLNIRARHPLANRPLIDLDMALFLAPMEMAGALLGVIVQRILPTWGVIVLMAVILGFTAYKTFRKGFSTLKKERALKKERQVAAARVAADADAQSADADAPKADAVQCIDADASRADAAQSIDAGASGPSPPASARAVRPDPPPPRETATQAWPEPSAPQSHWATGGKYGHLLTVEEWLERDAAVPFAGAALLLVMWLTLIALLVVKGGKGTSGIIEYCSASYWVVTAVSFVWLFGFALCMGGRAVRKTLQRTAVDYPFVEGDVRWTWRTFRFYCLITFLAGVVAGLIGIGGGMVLGPMMLQLGLHPQVSAATTATMIVLTSSSAAIVYVTAGLVPAPYAATFFGLAFVGAYLGKRYIDGLVKKHQLTAIIVLILASIIAFASAMMTINGVLIYSDRDWHFDGFNDIC